MECLRLMKEFTSLRVTFIKDSPARGTVRHIGKEVNSIGNVYIIVGLELVGNHNF